MLAQSLPGHIPPSRPCPMGQCASRPWLRPLAHHETRLGWLLSGPSGLGRKLRQGRGRTLACAEPLGRLGSLGGPLGSPPQATSGPLLMVQRDTQHRVSGPSHPQPSITQGGAARMGMPLCRAPGLLRQGRGWRAVWVPRCLAPPDPHSEATPFPPRKPGLTQWDLFQGPRTLSTTSTLGAQPLPAFLNSQGHRPGWTPRASSSTQPPGLQATHQPTHALGSCLPQPQGGWAY